MNDSDSNTRHGGQEPHAPAKLVAALKELPSRRVFVPPAVDEAVLAAARRHFAGPERSGFSIFREWLKWPALAAACIVIIGGIYFSARQSRRASSFVREDLNQDGKVDILDAFQLARELRGGTQRAAGPDVNGDGVADQRDVEIIARHAVHLEKGRS